MVTWFVTSDFHLLLKGHILLITTVVRIQNLLPHTNYKVKTSSGYVTKLYDSWGIIDNEIQFSFSACTKGIPKLKDYVNIETIHSPGTTYKWRAIKVILTNRRDYSNLKPILNSRTENDYKRPRVLDKSKEVSRERKYDEVERKRFKRIALAVLAAHLVISSSYLILATMKLRRNFLPRSFADWISFIFIGLVIPLFYWFEMFVVVAEFYPDWSFWYCWHFAIGTFIMVNTVGNLLATMFVDTSIFGAHLEVLKNQAHAFCTLCQLPVPPRCWHCDICNRCILKRDHHCTFAGYCIGQLNHRYFMMFLTSLFVACCYALYLNAFYILPRVDLNIFTVFQIVTPIMLVLLDGLNALKYILMMMLVLNVVGLGITGALSYFHWKLVLEGAVSFEHNRDIRRYNFGWHNNLVCVFGLRWYLTWISPFVESTMVFDGADWDLHKVLPKTKVI